MSSRRLLSSPTLALLLLINSLLLVDPTVAATETESKALSGQDLFPFASQYERIAHVAMTAIAQIQLDPQNWRVGTIEIEFWSSGDRYRLHSKASQELEVIGDTEASFDGEYYRLWLRQGNVLSIQREDAKFPIAAITNPLFFPIYYLTPNFPAAPTSLAGATLTRLASAQPVPGKELELTVEVPSALDGEVTRVRIVLQPQGDLLVPHEIHRETLDGRVLATLVLGDYEATGRQALLLPRTVFMTAFVEEGSVIMTAEVHVTSLDIDNPIEASQFIVTGDEETRIWDSEGERFVDEWPPQP
ncbi:MAG: hypothetical protein K8J08_18845 [Thermoanaerobaculia bacterium]|nr:hypothetical protein [Thermoanaerobaculia bacterium]